MRFTHFLGQYGLVEVKKDDKWGIINTTGDAVIDFKYDGILKQNSKIGYIIVQVGKKANIKAEIIDYSGKIISNKELEKMFEAKG